MSSTFIGLAALLYLGASLSLTFKDGEVGWGIIYFAYCIGNIVAAYKVWKP